MTVRRISVPLPCALAEDLAAMAVRSGVRPSEIVVEALRQYEPFRHFARDDRPRDARDQRVA